MIKKISAFFQSLSQDQHLPEDTLTLELATAVLLFEVMAADDQITLTEQNQLKAILTQKFSLSAEEVEQTLFMAQEHASHATDLYRFTKLVNEHTDISQRIAIIEKLWQVAFADGVLSNHEEHLLRKIADLLHLRHNEYINAKLRAEQTMAKQSGKKTE
jgi:uncharacterized tellurite resistance protein B-like protein